MGKRNYKIILALSLSLMLLSGFVYAQEVIIPNSEINGKNNEYHINLDQMTIAKGYTVSAFANTLKLSLVPGILSEGTGVDVIAIDEAMDMPWQLDKISPIYQFEFKNKNAYDNNRPFYIQFKYDKKSNNYKQVYFFDKNYNTWRPLPTKDFPDELFVRSLIHLPYARIAVFANEDILTIGQASWYGYKRGNFAASPDFPVGSKLRVYNIDNNKFIDVAINDYGPDRNLHPGRVIDLDKVAFAKISTLGSGIINVKIEPLYIEPDIGGKILHIADTGANILPAITAKSAIIYNEDNNEIIFSKNSTSTLPLASLTKLVAVKVFFDTKPSLNRIVSYSVKDEEYNYNYVDYRWEAAILHLNDGDTLTIENLLYASLVGSANNTIETLARVSGLNRNEFINKMNDLAASWGASSTKFMEPTGLSPENVSSAMDYAIITREALKHPLIAKASAMAQYKFYTLNNNKPHTLKNTNKLLSASHYNITGSKTGYLHEAGYCLMTRVKAKNNQQIIVITLGIESRDQSFLETEELIRYGLKKIN